MDVVWTWCGGGGGVEVVWCGVCVGVVVGGGGRAGEGEREGGKRERGGGGRREGQNRGVFKIPSK